MIITRLIIGCGIPVGRGTPNDVVPSGTVLAQGSFTSLNDKSVTGNAIIYRVTGANYVVRLEGIQAPEESGLQIKVIGNSQVVYNAGLRATDGSQNYPFTSELSPVWNSVDIFSAPNNLNYGQALLITAGSSHSGIR